MDSKATVATFCLHSKKTDSTIFWHNTDNKLFNLNKISEIKCVQYS